ncbi:MAG: FeoB-associated Cys-rich membrane protein [Ruminococcaceae bacterium]|nr:FeoB-associated Cys-rich membrane protein [Oscillospiraceae bacterium]
MKWFEILILAAVIGYCAYIVFGKKKRGCNGNCSQCSGCSSKNNK